ncbi:hypothetical protein OAO87_02250 [bacterium]|nr:hypothetical protein [bacterium]
MQCRAQSAGTLDTPHLATQPHGSRASLYSSPRPTLDGQVARDEDDRKILVTARKERYDSMTINVTMLWSIQRSQREPNTASYRGAQRACDDD